MRTDRLITVLKRSGKAGVAALLTALVLWLATVAIASPLHSAAHSNSSSPGHGCFICLFTKGQVDSPPPTLSVGFFLVLFFGLALSQVQQVFVSPDRRLPSSRAPPSFSVFPRP